MAATEAGTMLTEQHRVAQARLLATVAAQVAAVWPLFDLDDIDGSWPGVEQLLLAIVAVQGAQSSQLAAGYFQGYRFAETADIGAAVRVAAPPTIEAAIPSLRILGPIGTKKLIAAGRPDPLATTFTNIVGDVGRQVLNQGRDTLVESVRADSKAVGWARVTSGRACSFCAMLSSRGPVYKAGTVGFRAHGHCGCSVEPVYHVDAWPPSALKWRDEWQTATQGRSGADARLAFRQHIEGRAAPEAA